jgi:N-dimethylarginine dimethylaminohydrolase
VLPLPTRHLAAASTTVEDRRASLRRYLVCPPTHFAVHYAINPWMDPTVPVDTRRALDQWEALIATYRALGHDVVIAPPVPGLPDMVFAANAALVVDGIAVGARYATEVRAPEAAPYRRALQAAGIERIHRTAHVNEGEGDLLAVGDVVLAGTGYRTDVRAHAEVAALTGREVVTLHLVDPRYYHLDTALAVLDGSDRVGTDGGPLIAYLPDAFAPASRTELQRRYPDAIEVAADDAAVLGLNAVSDGHHVVLNREAQGLAAQLETRGFVPVPVDLSELRAAGGGPKCCTLELRPAPGSSTSRPAPGSSTSRPAPGSSRSTPDVSVSRSAPAGTAIGGAA